MTSNWFSFLLQRQANQSGADHRYEALRSRISPSHLLPAVLAAAAARHRHFLLRPEAAKHQNHSQTPTNVRRTITDHQNIALHLRAGANSTSGRLGLHVRIGDAHNPERFVLDPTRPVSHAESAAYSRA